MLAPLQSPLRSLAVLNKVTILGHQVLAPIFKLIGTQALTLQLTCEIGNLVLQGLG